MDANTVEACVFAAPDELGKVRQGQTDWNSERNADTPHSTTFVPRIQRPLLKVLRAHIKGDVRDGTSPLGTQRPKRCRAGI
jgi:hypothetical protein